MSGYLMVDVSNQGGMMPTKVNFVDHMIPFDGVRDDPELIWGAYGTTSANSSLFLAQRYAKAHKKTAFQLTVWYLLPGFHDEAPRGGKSLGESIFLHMGRLNAKLRTEVREIFMETVLDERGRDEYNLCAKMKWEEFLSHIPDYVRRLMFDFDNIKMIMHPVNQLYDKGFQEKLYIATARKNPSHIMEAEVRFIPDIEVFVA
jgi:hypothetical protein